jgi:hypothetical protein
VHHHLIRFSRSPTPASLHLIPVHLISMSLMRSLLLLILAWSWEVAATLRSGRYCFDGCLYTLGCVTFNDTSSALPHKIRTCKSTLRATSLYLCIENYCDDEGRSEWLTGQNGTCQKTTGLSLPPYEVVAEYLGTVDGVRRLSAEEGFCDGNAVTLGEVVVPGERYHDRAYRTLVRLCMFLID